MQARLLKDEKEQLWLMCSNGIMIPAKKNILMNILTNFKAPHIFNNLCLSSQESTTWNTEYPTIQAVPGETMAYITDALDLVVINWAPFQTLFEDVKCSLDELLTVAEYAQKYNKSVEQVKVFCRTGRIPGAKKIGRDWVIPMDAPYPLDNRRKI